MWDLALLLSIAIMSNEQGENIENHVHTNRRVKKQLILFRKNEIIRIFILQFYENI